MKNYIIGILLVICFGCACSTGVNGASGNDSPDVPETSGKGGYLFAHMTPSDYGSLFYSLSRDGIKWQTVNGGKIVLADYYGHPDICKGPDVFDSAPFRYYMIGVIRGASSNAKLILWHTEDLIVWRRKELNGNSFDVSHLGLSNEIPFIGAPKMFYDEDSGKFLITWHASVYTTDKQKWETMRTCYVLTSDFSEFTSPARFFASPDTPTATYFEGDDADIALIDVIIRKFDGKYYAIMKDERWEDKAPKTHKSIRIASSDNLLGPYSNPGPSISPNWREAPILVHTPEGKFRIYYEDYTNAVYQMRESTALTGEPWKDVTITPPIARHGCIIPVDEKTYQAILKNYPE